MKCHVPTVFFRRRRAVFILLAMPPPSYEVGGIAKRLFFYVYVLVPQYFTTEPFFVLVAVRMVKMMQTTMKASVVKMMPMAERLAIARNTR